MMIRILKLTTILLVWMVVLTACGSSAAEEGPSEVEVSGESGLAAEMEADAEVTDAVSPATIEPLPLMEEAASEEATSEEAVAVAEEAVAEEKESATAVISTELAAPDPNCTNEALFVADVTIPDDTQMELGQQFVKTWRIQNTGSCTWDSRYFLMHVDGERLNQGNGPAAYALPVTVKPGQIVELSIPLFTPDVPGTYQGDWKFLSPQGAQFGVGAESTPFWVRIVAGDGLVSAVDETDTNLGSVSGFAWLDKNENNLVDAKELLVEATILLASGEECRTIRKRVISDEDGRFAIPNVAPGSYCLIGANGSTPLVNIPVEVGANQALTGIYLPWPTE